VVPAYNEERRLGESLRRLIEYAAAQPYASEIIVVDDGSTDATPRIAREAAASPAPPRVTLRFLQHDRNRGKGAAVRTGMLTAAGDAALIVDADLAMPPEEIAKLLDVRAAGGDVAAGSRIQPSGYDLRASQPAWRRLGGKLFTFVRKRILLPDFADTQCGFKAFRREAARALFSRQQLDGWAFDAELLYLAQRLGFSVRQVPVEWRNVEGSTFRLGVGSALRELRDLLRIRWLHRGVRR
jgi:dolichyl-phosphate beta-glucosyltransferase